MYQSEELPVVGPAEELAEKASLADRMVYRGLIEAAERFAAGSGLVVCGRSATRLLLGGADGLPPLVGLDSFQYDFACADAPRQAKALTDALWATDPEGLGHYAMMLSKIPGQLMLVLANGRALCTVQSLPTLRGVPIARVLSPSKRPAQFARDEAGAPLALPCLGPDLQLIGTYAALANPAKAESWPDLLSEEAALRALYLREAEARRALAIARSEHLRAGGAEGAQGSPGHRGPAGLAPEEARAAEGPGPRSAGPGGGAGEPGPSLAARARPGTAGLRRALLDHYATGPGRVLVGPFALAAMTGERGADATGRVQVVAAGSLEVEAAAARAIAQRLGYAADWTVNDPKCPVDPRLRRATVYVTRAGRREPVLDIYNAAAHELVPYATVSSWGAARSRLRARTGGSENGAGGAPGAGPAGPGPGARRPAWEAETPLSDPDPALLKVGTPFVLMRFLLADMWTIQVLLHMGAVSAGLADDVLADMLRSFQRASETYVGLLALHADPESRAVAGSCLLPLAHEAGAAYVGRLEDPELALRRAAAGRPDQRRYPPYYAAARREAKDGAESNGRDGAKGGAKGGAPGSERGLSCEDYAPSRRGSASSGLVRRAGWDDAWLCPGEDC